jgi:mannose-6-phosphate isomerase-like protein (cupin superfamily)
MKNMSCGVVRIALLAVIAVGSVAVEAQTPVAGGTGLGQSKAYLFDEMTARKNANGGESRTVLSVTLKTGESVGVHESMQPAGAEPVALHAIQHSELVLVQEGTVGFEHDGKTEKVGPGGVIYVAFGTTHRVTNLGDGPAKYFVVQIGGDTKK